MSRSQNPTVLIVHGAWHTPSHFSPLSNLLNAQDFPTSCPPLPSASGSNTATMYDDAIIIRAELDRLILNENKEVIVLMHSYGGIVGTEAVHASLGRLSRKTQGLSGGVIHLIYMSAFMLPVGKKLAPPTSDGKLPPAFGELDGLVPPPLALAEEMFYNDLPPTEKTKYTSLLLRQSAASFLSPLSYTAWLHHPVSYLMCKKDNAVGFEKQGEMILEAEAELGGSGDESVRRFECESGHSPFLSMPEKVVGVIREVAGGVVV